MKFFCVRDINFEDGEEQELKIEIPTLPAFPSPGMYVDPDGLEGLLVECVYIYCQDDKCEIFVEKYSQCSGETKESLLAELRESGWRGYWEESDEPQGGVVSSGGLRR